MAGLACRSAELAIEAIVFGRAAHAGAGQVSGISAIAVAAEAIAAMPHGRVDPLTIVNVGLIEGGEARNVVPARVRLGIAVLSDSEERLATVGQEVVVALERAARRHGARVQLTLERTG